MAHSHTYTITNALSLKENQANPPYTPPTPHARRLVDPLPNVVSDVASVSTEALTLINVFDGTSAHLVTSNLPSTTKAPTTITASGVNRTIPGTTAIATDDRMHAYPADGCWDDPKCWSSYTHSKALPTVTNPAVKGYDFQGQPSLKKFFKNAAPFFALGIGIVCLIVFILWIALRYKAKRQKRRDGAKERQSKRMSGEEEPTASGGNAGEPIELETMRREGQAIRQEGGFEGRSDMWATHASTASEDWFRGPAEIPRHQGSELERRPALASFV
ncbi:MAG: hypothetical protein LQ338_003439 [Usnochroma carphineum]|nr:MAG: hypothetical protein LQ338_003439 [Usnochroma carphineum]